MNSWAEDRGLDEQETGGDAEAAAHAGTGERRDGQKRDGMFSRGFARWLLAAGLFWLSVGMTDFPGKYGAEAYHWLLAPTLYFPALWLLVRERAGLARPWVDWWPLRACALLLVWSCVTLFWATGAHLAERMKVPIFVVLYLTGWFAWAGSRPERIRTMLQVTGVVLAFLALAAMIAFPWRDIVWKRRMVGFALLDGPNLSAYAMGIAFVWLTQLPLPGRWGRWVWVASLAILAVFVAWAQSRAAWLAVLGTLVLMPLWRPGFWGRVLAGAGVLVATAVAVFDPHELLQRGLSYRPQILVHALEKIAAHPWGGLGLGSRYTITVGTNSWTHSHNLFTNVAIEIGLPGLALWLGLWLWTGWQGWRARHHETGRVLLAIWVFSTVALQFDGPSLLLSPRSEWLLTWLPFALAILIYRWRDSVRSVA
jgi:O-antigen ligase